MKRILILSTLFFSCSTIYGQTSKADSVYHHDDGEKIYHENQVDTKAMHPDGEMAEFKWISTRVNYPLDAKENDIQGVVYGCFIVEKDGSISNPIIIRSLHESCDNEVLRLYSEFPAWKPATKDGEAVRSERILPVRFQLTGTARKSKNKKGKN